MEKIFVCKTTQISVGQMKKISVDGKDIVVANIGGDYFAMNDTCTHASASLSELTLGEIGRASCRERV